MKLLNSLLALLLAPLISLSAANASTQGNGFRSAELAAPSDGKSGFTLLPPQATGIEFTNTLDHWEAEANRVLVNGSGVALGDYDNDGRPDIYLTSLNDANRLYRNLGNWKFADVTEKSGVVCSNRFCRGAVFADIDGDDRLDLLVATTGEGVLAFKNMGNGSFRNATAEAGTATPYGSVTLALADVDGNGTLDLYVANNRTDDIRDRGNIQAQMVNGKLVLPPQLTNRLAIINGKLHEYGEPDVLYLNDGAGRFSAAPWVGGMFMDEEGRVLTAPPMDWGLTATFRDMNQDGVPDLYVCNDYWSPDRIWINDGTGKFRAIARLALRNTSASSMGVDFADVTRSGRLDFFVVDMLSRDPAMRKRQMLAQTPQESAPGRIEDRPQFMRNTFFIDRGDGSYAEAAEFAGLTASEWSWSPVFLDVDLDGYEDLLITTGHVKDVQDLDASIAIQKQPRSQPKSMQPKDRLEAFIRDKVANSHFYPHLDTPIVAYRNLGGYKFEDVTEKWGTSIPGVHHSIATADLDGDGDLDLVVNSLGRAAGVYRNNSPAPRVAVRLKGRAPNTQGIGAKIELRGGPAPMQSHEVFSGGRYMAGSDPAIAFAASTTSPMSIAVHWRSGKTSLLTNVLANRSYEVDETSSQTSPPAPATASPHPLFEDVSAMLSHAHVENVYDDYARQPLLPRKMSQQGPGVVWADLNGDGWDDLAIASGKGGRMALFQNREGTLSPWDLPSLKAMASSDQAGLLALGGRFPAILAASANYEAPASSPSVLGFSMDGSPPVAWIPALPVSVGPIAACDIDADGRLDLFVGGRVIPGKYPEAAPSYIYRGTNGGFILDAKNSAVLRSAGLVNSAVFGDLDDDGFAELVLACEWGPVRVFKNNRGNFTETTEPCGLAGLTGWWTSVALADLNADGRLDIVAGNWGLNTPYRASEAHPARLYFGPLTAPGSADLVETEFDARTGAESPRALRDSLLSAIPDLQARFPTHAAYARASTAEALGPLLAQAKRLEASTLATTLFLNTGRRFSPQPLPFEVQLAPVFGIACADFNGDGFEDLFLGQNFFATRPEMPRHDGGRGILLLGAKDGQLRVLDAEDSGLAVYGEARGAASADYDRDGRPDLVIGQNGAATKLYRNIGGNMGVRVKLFDSPDNAYGVGATVRARSSAGLGPARAVCAGSGWLSQNSPVQLFVSRGGVTGIQIRWPGGDLTEHTVESNAFEIAVSRKIQ